MPPELRGVGFAPLPPSFPATKSKRNLNPLRGSTPDARIARRMKAAGQSPRDPRRPIGGKPRSSQGRFLVERCGGAKATSNPGTPPRLNLRRPIRVGAWNVLTLSEGSYLPVLSSELARLGVAVAALSETRLPYRGETSVGGYTYYWSGAPNGHRVNGVAVAVADQLVPLIGGVTPVSERILRLRITHSLGTISLVAVYAPHGGRPVAEKEAFYAELDSVVNAVPKGDTLIVLGDFNATTGTSRADYEACVGPHGSGARDESSLFMLDFAKSRGLRIAGSWFQRSDPRRYTWYQRGTSLRKEIDHVLVDGRWSLLQNCRVFRSANLFSTDHRLLVATLRLRLRTPRRAAPGQQRPDVARLGDPGVAQEFASKLGEALNGLDATADSQTLWDGFKRSVLDAAGASIPRKPRGKRAEVSPETADLIEESRRARLEGKAELFRALNRDAIRALRADKESRVRELCGTVESHLSTSDSRPAYRAIRTLRASGSNAKSPTIRAADGTILAEEEAVKARWAEYFEELFRVDPPSRELPAHDVTPLSADPPISCDPPTLEEVRKGLGQLRDGKAPGVCGVYAEMLKAGGETALLWLHTLICSIWSSGDVPLDWKRGIIVPIWKGKGDTRECGNYRGVTLLSVPGKVFARVLLNRVRDQLLAHQRPEQSGFTPKRSTVDRILALRVLTERFQEFDRGLFAAYIDFKKAFDSVDRATLWRVLGLRGIPTHLVHLISTLYSGTEGAVKCGGAVSDAFPVNAGVRQGCVLAPSLFSTCMDWIMERVVGGTGCGVSFGNVRITDLDFADDAVVFAETIGLLVGALERLSEEAGPLGLRVSWLKTKAQVFGDLLDKAVQSISVQGESVEIVEGFTYLGSVVHRSTSCKAEVNRRIAKARGAMNSLNKTVWRSRHLSRGTKVRVFRSLVMSVLLYSCEAWTLTADLRQRLDSFLTSSLRRIFGYRWQDHVSNQEVLDRAGMGRVSCLIRERQLRFYGHVVRFPEEDPAYRILLARDPLGWGRPTGRPRASWLRQLGVHMEGWAMGPAQARTIARRKPDQWRKRVDAAKCRRGTCSHT